MTIKFEKLRILALLLVFVIFLTSMPVSFVFAEEQDVNIEDEVFLKISEFYSQTGILTVPTYENLKISSVSRGKFALIIYQMMTGNVGNEELTEIIEDDGWLWLGEKKSEEKVESSSGFGDVAEDSVYAEAVKYMLQSGYMNGYGDGNFGVNDRITGNEALKVLVTILGCGFKMDASSYPTEYFREARHLGLLSGIEITDYNMNISARDVYVLIYNALCAEPYLPVGFEGNSNTIIGASYTQREGYMLMTDLYGIYSKTGIMTGNADTMLTSSKGLGEDGVIVGNVFFKVSDNQYYDLLGYKVKAFYKLSSDKSENYLVYAEKYNNEELTVPADNIDRYTKPIFHYFDNRDSEKNIRINGDEDVIYNGKAITDYSNEIFEPYNGCVTFIDNDSDSRYDVIKIESFKVIFVDSVSYPDKLFTDKYSAPTDPPYNLYDKDYTVYDARGALTDFTEIQPKCVLIYKNTLATQGEELIEIYISDEFVVGLVEKISDEKVFIDGVAYEISESCKETLSLGKYGLFYLTSDLKIAGYEYEEKNYAQYGYIMTAADKGPMDEELYFKLYTEKDEFIICKLAKNVKLNGQTVKAKVAYDFIAPGGQVNSQLIWYSVNADGELISFDTAGGKEDGFVKGNKVSGQYRSVIKGIVGNVQKCFFDSNTMVMYVPKTDKTNKRLYSVSKTFSNDSNYSFDEVYYPRANSVVADVMIKTVTEAMGSSITSNSTPITLVDHVENALSQEGDEVYRIVGYSNGSKVTRTFINPDFFDKVKTLKCGDVVRCQNNAMGYVSAFEKIYDITTRRFVGTKNPVTTNTSSLVTEFTLVHGLAYDTAFESDIIKVQPYDYSTGGEIVPQTDETKMYLYRGGSFTVTVYDSERKMIYKDNYKNIVLESTAGNGDDLLVYTVYSDPREIIVIR